MPAELEQRISDTMSGPLFVLCAASLFQGIVHTPDQALSKQLIQSEISKVTLASVKARSPPLCVLVVVSVGREADVISELLGYHELVQTLSLPSSPLVFL